MADSIKRYIAVDLGATGGKVVLASVAAGNVTTETVCEFSLPHISIAGREYWDIYSAYAGILKGLTMIGSRKLSVESIGIDSWGRVLSVSAGTALSLVCRRLAGMCFQRRRIPGFSNVWTAANCMRRPA